MNTSVVIYARASAECVTSVEDQINTLQTVASTQGWTVARTYIDRPLPLKRGREKRPGETALLAAIRAGGIDKVLLFSLDRVGRSVVELISFLEACRSAGVGIYVQDRQIDTDTATGNGMALFDVASMMAHHIRQGRRDRILRGQAAARNAAVRFGRPPIASARAEQVRLLLTSGTGIRKTARLVGISAASVSRLKETMAAISA